MERLPTELVIHILRYMSKDELKAIGFVSFEYRSLVLPFLFNRIRLWSWMVSTQGISSLIACLQSNVRLSSAIRVLDAEFKSGAYREEDLRRIMKITPSWDGLTLPAGSGLPLSVFDDQSKLRLRRLRCTGGPVGLKFNHLLLNILPACTNLVELEIPDIDNRWFQNFDASGSVAAVWINRLRKYRGPPFPLSYLHSTALCQLTSTAEVPSPMLQTLGLLVGQQLVALFVHVHLIASKDFNLIGKNHLPPSTIPSLFPNLQYVGWFLIVCAPKSASVRMVLAFASLLTTDIHDLPSYPSMKPMSAFWARFNNSAAYVECGSQPTRAADIY